MAPDGRRTNGRTERRADGRMGERTDEHGQNYIPALSAGDKKVRFIIRRTNFFL